MLSNTHLPFSEEDMSLPKILLENIQVSANEEFTETIYTFARIEKLLDNHGCISVSPNGFKIAVVDPGG